MTFDELSKEQLVELKQRILVERNDQRGEGTSYGELADADELVSDEDLKDWYGGTVFSPDDFTCSATPVFHVRVTWPVSRTYRVWAKSPEDAVAEIRARVGAGEVCVWTDRFEAGDDVAVEAVKDDGTEQKS